MAEFSHACFISYKHPPDADDMPSVKHFWLEFVEAFQEQLEKFLNTPIRSYRDPLLLKKPGVPYPKELSQKLCKSVCLVAILVPEYLESNWCRAEWKAMTRLETKRLGKNEEEGLLIPVLLQGSKQQAEEFAGVRVVVDLRKIIKPRTQLDSVKNRQIIQNIANRINEFCKQVTSTCEECETFRIEVGKEAVVHEHTDPNPLEQ